MPRPGALTQLSALGAKAFLQARATYLGNYPEGGGSAKATECRLCLATSLMRRQQQHGIVLLALLVLGGAGLGIAVLRRRTAGTTSHSFAITALFLDGIVTVQFLTATYGEAVETTKHLVIAVLAGLLTGYCLIASLATGTSPETPTPVPPSDAHKGFVAHLTEKSA